jgi:hypothetical protein
MFRVRVLILSLLAILALSAVASTSAFGRNQWRTGAMQGVLGVGEKKEIFGGGVAAWTPPVLLETTINAKPFIMACDIIEVKLGMPTGGKIEGGNPGKISVKTEINSCTIYKILQGVYGPTVCKVKGSPFKFNFTGKLRSKHTPGELVLELEPGISIELEACGAGEFPNAEKFEFKGEEVCAMSGPTVAALGHGIGCSPLGSKLKVKEGGAEMPVKLWTGMVLWLLPVELWSVDQ